ncbi:MAG TPA: hypothetical protein VIL72_05465 [Beijerinckiaceae bacterium]|jgi:hypothetical protein
MRPSVSAAAARPRAGAFLLAAAAPLVSSLLAATAQRATPPLAFAPVAAGRGLAEARGRWPR